MVTRWTAVLDAAERAANVDASFYEKITLKTSFYSITTEYTYD